ncbi:TPA: alpha-2,3-sialyltransferase, partial [Campylobacter coli]|nr:alpha-2,3-sialyltransferase [Campylobacter coli]
MFYFIETNSILKSKNKSLLDFIFDIQEDLEKLHQENCRLEAHIKNQNSLLSFCMKYGTAKQRIQNQLSYRLGQTIINSKNIFKILFMPIFLLSNIISFKQERQVYNKKIKKDPSLILPPLEKYPDYQEAIKFKNYLSYRLGQVIIKGFK